MRFLLFNDYRPGALISERVHDLSGALPGFDNTYPYAGVIHFIENYPSDRARLEVYARTAPSFALSEVKLRAPIPAPGKILGAGTNYAEHLKEVGGRSSEWAADGREVFVKAGSSVIAPGETVEIPAHSTPGDRTVHEVELTVVIGKKGRNIPKARAFEYVFGYTLGIDMTILQKEPKGERSRRKSHDTFAPIGPVVVTADELGDPHDLDIKLWANGELRQNDNTGTMDLKVDDLIEYASSVMTLYPGDLIMTGSPGGAKQVHDGDRLVAELENIGRFEVNVRALARTAAGSVR